MTGLLRAVRAKVPGTCILEEGRRCEKNGCRILFEDAPRPYLVIDLDEEGSPLGEQRRCCDYLFVADGDKGGGCVAALELKRGNFRAGEVAEQLQAGAAAAERIVSENITVGFCPVVVGSAHKEEMYKLRKKGVSFRGRMKTVRSVRCGGRFTAKLCA